MEKKYAVTISFAEEQKELAETIAAFCKIHSLECYYYKEEYSQTAGKILEDEIRRIYQYEPCLTIVLWSETYCTRAFTKMEWGLICERAKAYPQSRILIWVEENSSNPPPKDLGYTPWKGNQYSLFKEILERVEKCNPKKKRKDVKKFVVKGSKINTIHA